MPSWTDHYSDAKGKRYLFENRLKRLRGAVKSGEGSEHISKAAENLRVAALSLIKARRALINEYPQKDRDGQLSRKLLEDEQRWLSLSRPRQSPKSTAKLPASLSQQPLSPGVASPPHATASYESASAELYLILCASVCRTNRPLASPRSRQQSQIVSRPGEQRRTPTLNTS